MEQNDTQLKIDNIPDEITEKKKGNNKLKIVIGVIVALVIIAAAVLSYIYLYKIPHDEAVAKYNEAVTNYNNAVADYNDEKEQYDVAVADLEERNQELDDGITSLTQLINTENIPIDEFLLEEPNSVLKEAREVPKDTAPAVSEMPVTEKAIEEESTENIESVTAEIVAETAKLAEVVSEVQAMGDYSDTIELLSTTEAKYQAMIDEFQGCEADVVWFSVDEDSCVLRFLVQLSNSNAYTLRGVTTEWIAYDKNDAIVGSFDTAQADIPANGQINYVGGAGSAHLSGTPARVEIKVTYDGLLTSRELPQMTVSNAQITDNGNGWYEASADCVTDADIQTVDLDGQFVLKNANGEIIYADFWSPDNLPSAIDANGKFVISDKFHDLPDKPTTAEIYVYYIMG